MAAIPKVWLRAKVSAISRVRSAPIHLETIVRMFQLRTRGNAGLALLRSPCSLAPVRLIAQQWLPKHRWYQVIKKKQELGA